MIAYELNKQLNKGISITFIVTATNNANSFKHRLDKLRKNQNIEYNWRADLISCGSHSLS